MKAKKLLALFIVFALFATSSAYIVLADDPPEGAQIQDMYSSWASWDIFMAESVYDLGNRGTYSNFRGTFTDGKFLPVYESLTEKFDADIGLEVSDSNDEAVTRGEIVSALYGVISEVLKTDSDISAIDYFIENGLINGRASGDYQLDQNCTTEEMIIFSVRVYEYLCYELKLDSKGLFWKITGENLPNTVYLLGTIHTGDASIYPLSKVMLEAFDNSAYLGVEANVYTMDEEDVDYMIAGQMITGGGTIRDYISEETYELYKKVAESFGISADTYDHTKPWAAATLIQNAMTADNATSFTLGMDMFFLAKAVNSSKNIVEIESVKYQIDMFNSFSNELQEMLLLSTISPPLAQEGEDSLSLEDMAQLASAYAAYLLEAVRTGDEAALTQILIAAKNYTDPFMTESLMAEYITKLWDIRDAAMAAAIERYLTDEDAEGAFFVAVGAGHTVGPTGIVNVLREKGYTVVFLGGTD